VDTWRERFRKGGRSKEERVRDYERRTAEAKWSVCARCSRESRLANEHPRNKPEYRVLMDSRAHEPPRPGNERGGSEWSRNNALELFR